MSNTKSASAILRNKFKDDPKFQENFVQEQINADIAFLLRDLRKEAGFTQARLAEVVGTSQSVIARLEDADYDGHSLSMIKKIADALGKRLEIRLVPKEYPLDGSAHLSMVKEAV
jgi:DNA-binding XRE family transcriptional regulator